MHIAFHACKALSIAAFLFYGLVCLTSESMVAEFERFRLSGLQTLTGSLEVLGALGLLLGYRYPPLTAVSSGGLALLMVLGVLARFRIHDPWTAMLPAIALFLVNAFVFALSFRGALGQEGNLG